MAALADALAARAPPEKPIVCGWPDALYVDFGLVGGAQLAWSEGPDDEPPAWLVRRRGPLPRRGAPPNA